MTSFSEVIIDEIRGSGAEDTGGLAGGYRGGICLGGGFCGGI